MKPTEPNSNVASDLQALTGLQVETGVAQGLKDRTATASPLITIFAMPKPFRCQLSAEASDKTSVVNTNLIQRNAIRSWLALPNVEVLLIGNEEGIAETAQELGAKHSGNIEFNKQGTPLVSSAFEIAHRETTSPILVYCNSDVILMQDFVKAIEGLLNESDFEQFVAFGRRTDLAVEEELEFDSKSDIESLMTDCNQNGTAASNACKEYFVFNRELYKSIPKFAIGRGNWDNWMIHSAKEKGFPVVSLSEMVTAIHQAHDYSHTGASRYQCYVSGDEAEENKRLAGGRHLISGSTASWKLTPTGIRREKPLLLSPSFWADIPRFVRLMTNLLTSR